MKIRVYYEDTDVGGIVYHSNYLNFCERARSEVFFQKNLMPILDNGHFVVKRLEADFIASAKLGDILDVTTSLVSIKTASFILKQIVLKDGKELFVLNIMLVFVSFDGKVQKIDNNTKKLILELFS